MPFRALIKFGLASTEASTVVISGASSGIGRALALEMARRSLTARRMPLLEQLRGEFHVIGHAPWHTVRGSHVAQIVSAVRILRKARTKIEAIA